MGPSTPTPGPNHITRHSFAQLPLSDKHMIKRSGSQDNYICWTWMRHFDLFTNSCSQMDVLCCLFIHLAMAGYDIGWSARILTRVSIFLWSQKGQFKRFTNSKFNILCYRNVMSVSFSIPVLNLSPNKPIPSSQQSQQPFQVRIYLI